MENMPGPTANADDQFLKYHLATWADPLLVFEGWNLRGLAAPPDEEHLCGLILSTQGRMLAKTMIRH